MLTEGKIATKSAALDHINRWKNAGLEVVFTNGCFDILHLGHIDYLEQARMLGDRLIVGLNSDDSIKRLKGEDRPINKLYARMRILSALQFVDLITPFEDDTPKDLITFLMPDVLVKGKDYDLSNIVGADIVIENGGTVKTIELTEGFSTTNIINKIKI